MATDRFRWPRFLGITELPFLLTLGVAVLVRVAVAVAFPPAFLMSDGPEYLGYSRHLSPNPDRPVGYSIFLRVLSQVSRSLVLVTTVQLVLGVLTAVVAYALLRRWGVSPWVGTLATVPMLFDALQLLFEHAVLSDVLFDFLIVGAVAALAWWPAPRTHSTALAGLLMGGATVDRVVGEPVVVLAAVFLVVLATSWRQRVTQVAVVLVAFAVPVTAYAGWYHHVHGSWAITQANGRALYMRTTTFVDCDKIRVPAYERVLCPKEPVGRRQDPTWYGWHSSETVPRLDPPPGVSDQQAMRDFALKAIEAQPGDYLRAVWRDFRLGFTSSNRDDHYEMSTSVKWQFATIVDYERSSHYMRLAFDTYAGGPPATHQPMAGWLASYGRHVFLRGPWALALVVVALVGLVVPHRPVTGPSLRPLLLLTLSLPLMLVLVPDVTAQFVWRYQLPLVVVLPLSSALGLTRLWAWVQGQSATRATASTD